MNHAEALSYQPDAHSLAALHDVTFAAIVGISGAGKTTLIEGLCATEPSVHMLVSDTSRAPRPGEIDGRDYHFWKRAAMLQRIQAGGFLTIAPSLTGDLYATSPEEYAHEGTTIMAFLSSAVPKFRQLPFCLVRTIAVVPPSFEVWQERMQGHDFTEVQRRSRLREARESLAFVLSDPETQCMVNDDLSRALVEFRELVLGLDVSAAERTAQQNRAHSIAQNILQQIVL